MYNVDYLDLIILSAGLSDLGCIGECVGLERLDLSFNDFTKLHRLASLEKLQYLNLAANRITSLGNYFDYEWYEENYATEIDLVKQGS